jgi:hypothetical protein
MEFYGQDHSALGHNGKEGDPCGNRAGVASRCYKIDDCGKLNPPQYVDHIELGTVDTCATGLNCCNPKK